MKVVILAGGISTERDVSLSSGRMIYQALKTRGHQAVLLDVYLGYDKIPEEDPAEIFSWDKDWGAQTACIGEKNPDIDKIKAMRSGGGEGFFGPGVLAACGAADLVFLALHGENGEDGRIQACFDLLGIRYTGTDYASSAICMDKGLTRELLDYHGIPVPRGIRLRKGEQDPKSVSFPCIVKASCGGSSVGVSVAENDKEYEAALEEGFRYGREVIVEEYIKGREFSVGVMDGHALPVIEIAPLHGFYDYKNKYQAGSTIETCPAEISDRKTREMKYLSEKAFQVLRLKNYARMDFMMNEDGELFCLEANTLPGMTPTSLLPQEALEEGMDYGALCERIMENALKEDC